MSEYDNEKFFGEYSKMSRSQLGLNGAGEWHQLKALLPHFKGKKVLDLGCGYGWHCKYAINQGADSVLGIDSSNKMLEEAKKRNSNSKIEYQLCDIEKYEYPQEEWDCVISNLALHYIEDIDYIFGLVYKTLKPEGEFVFNIEHPTFTSGVHQDWIYSQEGTPLYWPVDDYFYPGKRNTNFLGCEIRKYHHTLSQIVMGLLNYGFKLESLVEAQPSENMMNIPGMKDEMRRPMMLLIKVRK